MQNIREKISVVIPVFNEKEKIYSNLKEINKTFFDFGCNYELIICDDGSKDTTMQELKRFQDDFKDTHLIIVHNKVNYGKGRALKKSFKYTTGEYIVWLDADLDLHPSQIPTFFDIMQLTKTDIVIGSKRHPNSVLFYPLDRKFMSIVYFTMIKLLFNLPLNDTQTGLKLFKREALREVFRRILVKKFAFDLEVLVNAHHLGYKISEAPVFMDYQRKAGRIGISSIVNMILDTLAIWYRMYILKYYDRINHHRRKNMLREFKKIRRI